MAEEPEEKKDDLPDIVVGGLKDMWSYLKGTYGGIPGDTAGDWKNKMLDFGYHQIIGYGLVLVLVLLFVVALFHRITIATVLYVVIPIALFYLFYTNLTKK